jgi:5'(3')-deoxyribonucleotidase
MTGKKYIVCDVDLCLVSTDYEWFLYLESIAHKKYFQMCYLEPEGNKLSYDLSIYYPELTKSEAFGFWRNPTLYDKLNPITGSVECLTTLDDSFHVTFGSMSKPEHYLSKYNFVKKHFGDNMNCSWSFVSTHEKGISLKADLVIDDRVSFINQFDAKVLKVLMKTPYAQD